MNCIRKRLIKQSSKKTINLCLKAMQNLFDKQFNFFVSDLYNFAQNEDDIYYDDENGVWELINRYFDENIMDDYDWFSPEEILDVAGLKKTSENLDIADSVRLDFLEDSLNFDNLAKKLQGMLGDPSISVT